MNGTDSIAVEDFYGEHVHRWVLDRSAKRHKQWAAKNPGAQPDRGLLWIWVLDYCKLPGTYRRVLDALERMTRDGHTWPDAEVCERAGIGGYQLRKVIRPNLIAWGWLSYVHGIGNHGGAYCVLVPADAPDRMSTPAGSPQRSGGKTTTQSGGKTTTQSGGKTTRGVVGKPPEGVVGKPPPRKGKEGKDGKVWIEGSEKLPIHTLETGYREPPPERQLTLGTDELAKRRWRDPMADERLVADHLLRREQ